MLVLFVLAWPVAALAQPTEIQYLSGRDKDDAVPWKFFCTSGANSGFWTNLPVPSQWDMHGFGTLSYKKDQTNAWAERGLYEREFTVPPGWAGKRIFLVFDGVMTDTDAKLNGQSVGPVHQGGFYRFKYEVTPLVQMGGANKLEVTVARHSANPSVNDAERLADFWVFGGIYRPVYLEAVPPQFIERVAVDARADGSFSAEVFLNGATNADEVEAQIQTLAGENVGDTFRVRLTAPAPAEGVRLQTQITTPKLWTAETPNLYNVEIRLKQAGKTVHQLRQRFGFRTLEVRDGDGIYLNGRKIILQGANRHSFWPDSGRCLSETVHRLDIATMKDANMNAVRMSHYPPDEQFLDLCDELGLYVLDELAGWHHAYDNEVGPKLVREMVVRDVNHPAVLFWDNGNEGGFNTNFDKLFGEFDPQQRRVLHPWAPFNGFCTAHYLAYDKAEIAASGQSVYYHANTELVDTNDRTKYIYLPTEFQHGLFDGGAGAGLDDYWRLMMSHTNCAGGFIWALLDDGVKRPDTGAMDVAGNQAPDGIVGPYRQREGSFYTIKEIWSPIQVTRETNGTVTVENHYSFTDTRACQFTWQLRRYPLPNETNVIVIRQGVLPSPAIPPGGRGVIQLPTVWSADALSLRVTDAGGRELWTWVWPLRPSTAARFAEDSSELRAIPSATNGVVTVQAGEFAVTFSQQTGWLTGVRRGAQTFSFTNGPRPAVGSATLREIHFDDDGPDAFVSASYDGALKSVLWRISNNGWVRCRYTYAPAGTNDFAGVLFDYPESLVQHKRWVGDGPFRVWQNRLRGVVRGYWENNYNNTLTGFRDWTYPEFKGFFANVDWLQLDTAEGPITVIPEAVPFVQVLTPEFPLANLVGQAFAPVPMCGLGLLDAIPAIGSKFKPARALGPQSQPAVLTGEITGAVNFYFGPLP